MPKAVLRTEIDPSGAKAGARQVNRALGSIRDAGAAATRSLGRVSAQLGRQGIQRSAQGAKFALLGLAGGTGIALQRFGAFEEKLVGIGKVTDKRGAELQGLAQEIQKIAGEIPVATNELASFGVAAGQIGVRANENILNFIRTLGKLQVSTDVTGEQGARSLGKILKASNEANSTINNLGSAIVGLGNQFATTESQIISITQRITQFTGAFGLASEKAAAIGTALQNVGIQAERGGSAIGDVFLEAQKALREGGEQLDTLTQLLGRNEQQVEDLLETRPGDFFLEFIRGLKGVVEAGGSASSVLADLSLQNKRTISSITPLVNNIGQLEKAFQTASKEATTLNAINEEASRAASTLFSEFRLLANELNEVAIIFGREFAPVVDAASERLRKFLNELQASGSIEAFARSTLRNILSFIKGIEDFARETFIFFNQLEGQMLKFQKTVQDVVGFSLSVIRDFLNAINNLPNAISGTLGLEGSFFSKDALGLRDTTKQINDSVRSIQQSARATSKAIAENRQQIIEWQKATADTSAFEKLIAKLEELIGKSQEATKELSLPSQGLTPITEKVTGIDALLQGGGQARTSQKSTFEQSFDEFQKKAKVTSEDIKKVFQDSFSAIQDSLAEFIRTGEINFENFAETVKRQLSGLVAQGIVSGQGPLAGFEKLGKGFGFGKQGQEAFAGAGAGVLGAQIASGFVEGTQEKSDRIGAQIAGGIAGALGGPAAGAGTGALVSGLLGGEKVVGRQLRLEQDQFGQIQAQRATRVKDTGIFGDGVSTRLEDASEKVQGAIEGLIDKAENVLERLSQNFAGVEATLENVSGTIDISGLKKGDLEKKLSSEIGADLVQSLTRQLAGQDISQPLREALGALNVASRGQSAALGVVGSSIEGGELNEKKLERLAKVFNRFVNDAGESAITIKQAAEKLSFAAEFGSDQLFELKDSLGETGQSLKQISNEFGKARENAKLFAFNLAEVRRQFDESAKSIIQSSEATRKELQELAQRIQSRPAQFEREDSILSAIQGRIDTIESEALGDVGRRLENAIAGRQGAPQVIRDLGLEEQFRELIQGDGGIEELRKQVGLLSLSFKEGEITQKQLDKATNELISAFEEGSQSIREQASAGIQTAQEFKQIAESVKQTRQGLLTSSQSPLSPGRQFDAAQAQFQSTLQAALGGDKEAFGRLQGRAETLLDAAKDQFARGPRFADVFERVQQGLKQAEKAALGEAQSVTEQQLKTLKSQDAKLSDMRESLQNIEEGISEQLDELRNGRGQAGARS